jgi:hypothetical protein
MEGSAEEGMWFWTTVPLLSLLLLRGVEEEAVVVWRPTW